MEAELLRRVNLAEVLEEAAAAAGHNVEPLDEGALIAMTEEQIRQHFSSASRCYQPVQKAPQVPPAPSPETFAKQAAVSRQWFPGLARSGTATPSPRLRVVCLCSAGNAEDMYTSEGTGVRRAPSPLLEWCRAHKAEVLAVQPPARGARLQEAPMTSAQDLAQQVFDVLGSRLAQGGVPWVVVSHSMGCWVAYHLLRTCRAAGLPLPLAWCLSAMPAPDLPPSQRPWRRQQTLDEKQFIDECRAWDINEAVFAPGMWELYQPLLRADFTLFDSYVHDGSPDGPFPGLPIHSWWGTEDRRVTKELMQGWSRFTTGPFTLKQAAGNHLWPLSKDHKKAWLQDIANILDNLHI